MLIIVAMVVLAPLPALADETHDRAARAFEAGEGAFASGEYRRAAALFEQANALAPHPSALINAAKAWIHASENAKAANLLVGVVDTGSSRDRAEAKTMLDEIEPRLGQLVVRADDPSIDGASVVSGATTFVEPGEHSVRGRVHGRVIERTVRVGQGEQRGVALALALDVAPPPHPPEERHGLPRIVTYALGGATIVAGGLTLWSGLDVLAQKRVFDRTQADQDLDDGLARQRRTNILIGVTAGLAVLTGVAAIFTSWSAASTSEQAH
jgi:hypothetical protein